MKSIKILFPFYYVSVCCWIFLIYFSQKTIRCSKCNAEAAKWIQLIFWFMRHRERQRHQQKEKKAPCRGARSGTPSQDLGIRKVILIPLIFHSTFPSALQVSSFFPFLSVPTALVHLLLSLTWTHASDPPVNLLVPLLASLESVPHLAGRVN